MEYILDSDDCFRVEGPSQERGIPSRWSEVVHCEDKRTSLFIIAGDILYTKKAVKIERDFQMYIRYTSGLPSVSPDGLDLRIRFAPVGKSRIGLIILPISGGGQRPLWNELVLDLSSFAGQEGVFELEVGPGPENDPTADWVAIADFCVARKDHLDLAKAKSLRELRTRNEIAHFSSTYRHKMYNRDSDSELVHSNVPSLRRMLPASGASNLFGGARLCPQLPPLDGELAYGYAQRLLGASLLPMSPPDFLGRLKARAKNRKLRVLSLCSGAARIEAGFAAEVGSNVEWSLFDINPDLLSIAALKFPKDVHLELIEGNVNDIFPSEEKWDVILCVSALHHVVELEKVIQFCHASLKEDGEFWSVGEYVGRNGNRLWPGAYSAANEVFSLLPERYRFNKHTKVIDKVLPDNDYSVGCYEGIRSENIEPIINRWFRCEVMYRRNCFLWRLTNLAYSDNFDLHREEDIRLLQNMVMSELAYFYGCREGTELFAIYRPV